MPDQEQKETAKQVSERTGRDPIVIAAAGSVLLAWFQYYILGNKQHGLFIGLWPPTLLAFSNTIKINNISRKVEDSASSLMDWLTQG